MRYYFFYGYSGNYLLKLEDKYYYFIELNCSKVEYYPAIEEFEPEDAIEVTELEQEFIKNNRELFR